jgi:hypothetical protein
VFADCLKTIFINYLTSIFYRDWTEERIQQYFVWSSYVLHGVKGTNEALEVKIGEVLGARGVKMSPPPENYQGYEKSGETDPFA